MEVKLFSPLPLVVKQHCIKTHFDAFYPGKSTKKEKRGNPKIPATASWVATAAAAASDWGALALVIVTFEFWTVIHLRWTVNNQFIFYVYIATL